MGVYAGILKNSVGAHLVIFQWLPVTVVVAPIAPGRLVLDEHIVHHAVA